MSQGYTPSQPRPVAPAFVWFSWSKAWLGSHGQNQGGGHGRAAAHIMDSGFFFPALPTVQPAPGRANTFLHARLRRSATLPTQMFGVRRSRGLAVARILSLRAQKTSMRAPALMGMSSRLRGGVTLGTRRRHIRVRTGFRSLFFSSRAVVNRR